MGRLSKMSFYGCNTIHDLQLGMEGMAMMRGLDTTNCYGVCACMSRGILMKKQSDSIAVFFLIKSPIIKD